MPGAFLLRSPPAGTGSPVGYILRMHHVRWLAILIAAGCTTDAFSFGDGSAHALVFSDGAWIEYSAPPLKERRRFTSTEPGTSVRVLLSDPLRGGFIGVAEPSAAVNSPLLPAQWSLRRYGPEWNVDATRTGVELLGPDSLFLTNWRLTPDGRFFVLQVHSLQTTAVNDLLVLNAVTLAVVDRRPLGPRDLYTGSGPTGATGSQMLFRSSFSPGCSNSLVWVNVETGLVADSTGRPCDQRFLGALSPQRLYFSSEVPGQPPRTVVWDAGTQTEVASSDSVVANDIRLDAIHDQLIVNMGLVLFLMDPQTLAVRGSITADPEGHDEFGSGQLDPRTGAYFVPAYKRLLTDKGFVTYDNRLVVLDLVQRRVAAQLSVGNLPWILP